MPAKSLAQAKFMGAVAGGAIKKPGLTPSKAKEFLTGVKVKNLPARAKSKNPMAKILKPKKV